MLERVAVRLESGGRRLLRGGRLRKRMLHSNFWVHGASEIDLVSAAAASLFGGYGEDGFYTHDTGSRSGTRKRLDHVHLDFLYPSKTLAFLHTLSIVSSRGCRKFLHDGVLSVGARRDYSSDTKPLKIGISPPQYLARDLDSLKALEESGLQDDYELLWSLYTRENAPTERMRQYATKYLLKSDRPSGLRVRDINRAITVIRSVDLEDRSSSQCEDLVHAYLLLGDTTRALALLEDMKKARDQITSRPDATQRPRSDLKNSGFEIFMAFYAVRKDWNKVYEAYKILRSTKTTENGKTLETDELRFILDTGRMPFLQPDYIRSIFEWAKALPLPWDGRSKQVDQMAEDLAKGCLYFMSKPGSKWVAEWDQWWDFMVKRERWFLSRQKWERLLRCWLSNRRADFVLFEFWKYKVQKNPRHIAMPIINGLLDELGNRNDIAGMENIIQDIFLSSKLKQPDRHTYNITMKHMARHGRVDAVESLLGAYLRRYTPERAKEFAHIMQAYSKRGELKEVINWFNRISKEFGLKPDLLCYNIMITAYGKAGKIDESLSIIETMQSNGVRPDVFTYGALVEVSALRGDVTTAIDVIDIVRNVGLEPTYQMYRALTAAFVKSKQPERAVEFLRICEQEYPKMKLTTMWNTVITGYLNENNSKTAKALFEEMVSKKVPFDSHTYGIFLHSLCATGNMEAAEETLDYLKSTGFKIEADKYAILMVGYIQRQSFRKVWSSFQSMMEDGITPNFSTLALLIKAYASFGFVRAKQTGDYDHNDPMFSAETIVDQIKSQFSDTLDLTTAEPLKSALPPWIFNPLIKIYTKTRSWQRAIRHFNSFLETQGPRGAEPNMKMYENMMQVYLQSGDTMALNAMYSSLKNKAAIYFTAADANLNRLHSKILEVHRFKLAAPLSIFIQAMVSANNLAEVRTEIDSMQRMGYELNNKNWNDYVQALANGGNLIEAMDICERYLMSERDKPSIYYRLIPKGPRPAKRYLDLPENRPFIRTLELLTTDLKILSNKRWTGDTEAQATLRRIERIAPRTLEACSSLVNIGERIEKEMAFRRERLQKLYRHSYDQAYLSPKEMEDEVDWSVGQLENEKIPEDEDQKGYKNSDVDGASEAFLRAARQEAEILAELNRSKKENKNQ